MELLESHTVLALFEEDEEVLKVQFLRNFREIIDSVPDPLPPLVFGNSRIRR
jgi:hypothetical protein